jgi:DNA-directed RNA polymerase subunit RPC12/RpoP
VGEEVKPQVTCTNCGKETSIKIKLDEITIKPTDKPLADSNIKITDDLTIVMRYPTMHDIDYNKSEVEIAFDMAKRCIESVILKDQVYEVKDINPQELSDFVDNMLPGQFAQIMDFIQSIPELTYEFQYKCPQCSESVNVQLKSVSDFFR